MRTVGTRSEEGKDHIGREGTIWHQNLLREDEAGVEGEHEGRGVAGTMSEETEMNDKDVRRGGTRRKVTMCSELRKGHENDTGQEEWDAAAHERRPFGAKSEIKTRRAPIQSRVLTNPQRHPHRRTTAGPPWNRNQKRAEMRRIAKRRKLDAADSGALRGTTGREGGDERAGREESGWGASKEEESDSWMQSAREVIHSEVKRGKRKGAERYTHTDSGFNGTMPLLPAVALVLPRGGSSSFSCSCSDDAEVNRGRPLLAAAAANAKTERRKLSAASSPRQDTPLWTKGAELFRRAYMRKRSAREEKPCVRREGRVGAEGEEDAQGRERAVRRQAQSCIGAASTCRWLSGWCVYDKPVVPYTTRFWSKVFDAMSVSAPRIGAKPG
ncbi:hypothetical protein C8R45DRAFT_948193 [Mycena sanguinolenta]|nr:hypothetical protein C8R45DRAFT_948193 [Mycena sanguinolenta]